MRYLTITEIIAIHDIILEQTGGIEGIRDENVLLSMVERPKQSFGGSETYKTKWDKAAAYLEGIALFHPFVDGNKRTALTTAFVSLREYTKDTPKLPIELTETFMVEVATHNKHSIETISDWLEKHSN